MPKIAIAHDYLTQRGGAERVVLAMLRAFPNADLYTTVYNPETTFPEFKDYRVLTTKLNDLALLRKDHRFGLPIYQKGIDAAPVIDADLLLVSTTGFAHGFRTTGKKLVYCHSPARFLYLVEDYLGASASKSPIGWALSALRPPLIKWDQAAAHSADRYLANSSVVKQRIADVYGMDATVVPAPPAVNDAVEPEIVAELADWGPGHHLVVSRLMPYKNVDKAIDAFRELPDERLVIVGKGRLGMSCARICRRMFGCSRASATASSPGATRMRKRSSLPAARTMASPRSRPVRSARPHSRSTRVGIWTPSRTASMACSSRIRRRQRSLKQCGEPARSSGMRTLFGSTSSSLMRSTLLERFASTSWNCSPRANQLVHPAWCNQEPGQPACRDHDQDAGKRADHGTQDHMRGKVLHSQLEEKDSDGSHRGDVTEVDGHGMTA